MQTKKLVTAALFIGAAACTDSAEHTIGMRADGVKVDCVARSSDVSVCAAVADACDAATVLWPPNHKMHQFTLADCAPAPGCGGGDGGGDGSGSGSGSGSGNGGDGIIERTMPSAVAAADLGTATITSVTADEAIEVGQGGDGHTTVSDITIVDGTTFELRSERQGGADGRVYRVNFVDGAGVTGSCEFHVPHNQGPTSGAIDTGTVVTLTP